MASTNERSTTELSDEAGDVTDTCEVACPERSRRDVFGALRESTGSTANDWLFTGEQQDGDSGLYYLRARHYDPATGRFMSRDPIAAGHPYAYVGGNPATWTDPSGLCELVCTPELPWEWCHVPFGGDCAETAEDAVDAVNNALDAASDPGYVDVNLGVTCVIGVTGGLQISLGSGIYPYAGGALSGTCGVSANLTLAPGQTVTPGVGCGFQYTAIPPAPVTGGIVQTGAGPTGQVGLGGITTSGGGPSGEVYWEAGIGGGVGVGIPWVGILGNATGSCYYVFPNITGLVPF